MRKREGLLNESEAKQYCKTRGCNNCRYAFYDKRRSYEKNVLHIPCWANHLNSIDYVKMMINAAKSLEDKYNVGDVVGQYRLIKKYPNFDLWERKNGDVVYKECFPRNINPMVERKKIEESKENT